MSTTKAPDWLVITVNQMLVEESLRCVIPLGHLCNPNRRTCLISGCRSRISAKLREMYILEDGKVLDRTRDDQVPVSYPIIGYCMGMDHSAIVYSIRKHKQRLEHDAAILKDNQSMECKCLKGACNG